MGVTVGQLLKAARHAAGLNQEELAALSGVPQGRISVYERGGDVPGLPILSKLVAGLREGRSPIQLADFEPDALATRNVTDLLKLTSAVTEPVVYRKPQTLHTGVNDSNALTPPAGGTQHVGTARLASPRPPGKESRYIRLPPDRDIVRRFTVAIKPLRVLAGLGIAQLGDLADLLSDLIIAFHRGQITSHRALEPVRPRADRTPRERPVSGRDRKKP